MTGKVATLVFGRRSAHWMLSGKCEIRNLRKRISRRADAVECNLYLELLERISLGRLGEFGYDQFMLAHYPKQNKTRTLTETVCCLMPLQTKTSEVYAIECL